MTPAEAETIINSLTALLLIWQHRRLSRVEKTLKSVAGVVNKCPTCRKRAPLAALLLVIGFLLASLA